MPRSPKHSIKAGFTLIEVLVAASLLAMIGIFLMTITSSAIETKIEVESISSKRKLVRQALSRMGKEIGMAFLSEHRTALSPIMASEFSGQKAEITFLAFANEIRREGAKVSDQAEISYFVGQDEDTNKPALMRRVKNKRDSYFGTGGRTQLLCPLVKSIEFQYYNSSLRRWEGDWRTEGGLRSRELPSRVKIKLKVEYEENFVETYETQVRIVLSKVIKIQ